MMDTQHHMPEAKITIGIGKLSFSAVLKIKYAFKQYKKVNWHNF